MKTPSAYRPFLSDVAYHDYVVALCFVDAEWSRRKFIFGQGNEPWAVSPSFEDLLKRCRKYRSDINENYAAFCRANGVRCEESVEGFLFEPTLYVSFGHADELSIVLLDDFDPLHYLTSGMRTSLQEICLGFCPKLDGFLKLKGTKSAFCHLHDALRKHAGPPKQREDQVAGLDPAQKTAPLLVFTKYKIDGLGVLDQGLLFQSILLKAMMTKTENTLALLADRVSTDRNVSYLMSKADIAATKCVLIDLQGPEEIGSLVFCSNYSAAMTIVAALRSLTYAEILQEDVNGRLRAGLSSSLVYRAVVQLAGGVRDVPPRDGFCAFRDNHVFRWTHSSLAVSPHIGIEPEGTECSGYVEASSEFQISAGHRLRVEKKLEEIAGANPLGFAENKQVQYHRFLAGTGDLLLPCMQNKENDSAPLVRTKEAISRVQKYVHGFGDGDSPESPTRDVVDVLTTMSIPVPRILQESEGQNVNLIYKELGTAHFAPLCQVLPKTQKRLCYTAEERRGRINEKAMPRMGRLDLTALRTIPRTYGIPVALRRSIEYLYQNFATLLSDPYLFDLVLDLYDTFATLHAVLTEHLPAALGREKADKSSDLGFIDGARVDQLAKLVDAIHNALMHRVSHAYPEKQIRDIAIDFRGGLNQILLAADAPVKCGLGLLRRYALEVGESTHRDTVGGLTRVGFEPGARCHLLQFGTEHDAILAYFEADVPHVLHPPSYCDNLHEAFHLIFEVLRANPSSSVNALSFATEVMEDRMSELFATLLCHLFVFGNDSRGFLLYHLCSYSKSLLSVGQDDAESVIRFSEFLIRLFVVADAIPSSGDPYDWELEWIRGSDTNRQVADRFEKTVHDFGPFYSEYSRLWNGRYASCIREYVRNQFRDLYPEIKPYMPTVWNEALRIYRKCVMCEVGGGKHDRDQAREVISKSLKESRPVIHSRWHMHEGGGTASHPSPEQQIIGPDDTGLGMIFLVCDTLHEYLPTYESMVNTAIHLFRRPKERAVDYPTEAKHIKEKGQSWNDFQIERGSAGMFCCVPSRRRRRLSRQITMLKTYWGLSSILRARRFWEILSDNFDLFEVFDPRRS